MTDQERVVSLNKGLNQTHREKNDIKTLLVSRHLISDKTCFNIYSLISPVNLLHGPLIILSFIVEVLGLLEIRKDTLNCVHKGAYSKF